MLRRPGPTLLLRYQSISVGAGCDIIGAAGAHDMGVLAVFAEDLAPLPNESAAESTLGVHGRCRFKAEVMPNSSRAG